MMEKVYIWGTGKKAYKTVKNGLPVEILGYIETYKKSEWFCGKRVYRYTADLKEYDAIIVASMYSNEIYLSAKKQGLELEKMIFLYPCAYADPEEKMEWVKEILGEKNFEVYLGAYGLYEQTFFEKDKQCYQALNKRERFKINEDRLWPIIKDKFDDAGTVSNYFWQDLWAAKLIYDDRPKEHYDIGSRLDGFIAHLLSYDIPVNMIDIRPFPTDIPGLNTIVDDATELKQFCDESIESLSALCSLEHFGLGRYGDPIDPEACFKCFYNIQKKMKPSGRLYISVPIGKERVEFNAHRVFYAKTIVESFDQMQLIEFSCTADGKIERNVCIDKYDDDINGGDHRYGLFYFKKGRSQDFK